jgi:homoserine kinase
MQRTAILTTAFENPDPSIIYGAMQDKVHQQYRQALIPGFQRCLDEIGLGHQGLLGLALSGAGPSVIALATFGFDKIGDDMKAFLSVNGCDVVIRVLDCDRLGARLIE